MRGCHRAAPFLFFNGNTFASIGRELAFALFSDLPAARKREVSSAIAHYIAGVLDRDSMSEIVEGMFRISSFALGDRVKTLKGSLHGVITRLYDDGRVALRPDGSQAEIISAPENLLPE